MSQTRLSLPGASKIAHLFIDASNVNVQHHEIPALDAIARAGFSRFATSFVVGSSDGPSPKPAVWTQLGYKVKWSQRHGQPESEYNVDSTIVSAMLLDVMTVHSDDASNHVLVLLSGDGNDNDGLPSLRAAVQQALGKGWAVKLVCYKPNPVYVAMEHAFPGRMQIQIVNRQQIAEAAKGCATVPVPAAAAAKPRESVVVGNKSRSRTPSPSAPFFKGPSAPLQQVTVPCSYFAAGYCKYGDSCKFQHAAPRRALHAVAVTGGQALPPHAAPLINVPKSYRPPAAHPSHHPLPAESHGHSGLESFLQRLDRADFSKSWTVTL